MLLYFSITYRQFTIKLMGLTVSCYELDRKQAPLNARITATYHFAAGYRHMVWSFGYF